MHSQLVSTTFLSLCSGLMLIVAALIETYLTPILAQPARLLRMKGGPILKWSGLDGYAAYLRIERDYQTTLYKPTAI